MILAIRSETENAELYIVNGNEVVAEEQWLAGRELSDELHQKIESNCNKFACRIEDFDGIIVYKGPGSFTGLRISIAAMNALAYGLQIPIVGSTSENWLEDGLETLHNTSVGNYAVPEYGAEPHITKQKK